MTRHDDKRLKPERSGVYLAPSRMAGLRQAAAERDLAWIELDPSGARNKGELLKACASVFDMPDEFGSNWDALSDCLRDLSWRREQGYVIIWRGASTLAEAAPGDFSVALEIFSDVATYWKERGRAFFLLLDGAVHGMAVSRLT